MSSFTYLQALAGVIGNKRFKSIEVMNDDISRSNTQIHQLYKLALNPDMTAAIAREQLRSTSTSTSLSASTFTRLMQRTITRLENLLLLTDPGRYTDDPKVTKQVAAVRSLVIGLYLSQNGVSDGAVFHVRKGLKNWDAIPAAWQGLCIFGQRYMAFHYSLHGPTSRAIALQEDIELNLRAIHAETLLRVRLDVVFAKHKKLVTMTNQILQEWNELQIDCKRVLKEISLPWFRESVTRIRMTALQITGQYHELLKQQANSSLPEREKLLNEATACIALNRLHRAVECAIEARTYFGETTINWLICTDTATRALLLVGDATSALNFIKETKSHSRFSASHTNLGISRKLLEAYCTSFNQLSRRDTPRRGRPTKLIQGLIEELQDASLARHHSLALRIWLLIEARAQHDEEQYDSTLHQLHRFTRRRKKLGTNSRIGVFVNFLFEHRHKAPTSKELREYNRRLNNIGSKYTDNEIIRFDILGKELTKRQSSSHQ